MKHVDMRHEGHPGHSACRRGTKNRREISVNPLEESAASTVVHFKLSRGGNWWMHPTEINSTWSHVHSLGIGGHLAKRARQILI